MSRSSEPRTSGGVDEDPAAIAKLVAGLFDEQNTAAYAKLEKIGKPAVPALVTALAENTEALLAEFAISNREHFGGKR